MDIRKTFKKNLTILLIITFTVLFIVLKDDFNNIMHTLQNMKLIYIILAILLYYVSISIKGIVNYLIVNDKSKLSIREAIKHNVIIQFFNGITPFSTGGQPMEVYLLKEHDIPLSKATEYTVQSFIFYQVALVICGALAVLYNSCFHIFPKEALIQHLVLLGFLINIAVVVVLILVSNSRRVLKVISNISYKICKKLKIDITKEEIEKKFHDYYVGSRDLKKRKKLIVFGILLNIISLLCLYSIPIIIIIGIGGNISLIETITSSAYVYVIGAFVPIPGGSGGIEYGFTQFFGNFIKPESISALLLVWRFITYYVGMIVGALVFYIENKKEGAV